MGPTEGHTVGSGSMPFLAGAVDCASMHRGLMCSGFPTSTVGFPFILLLMRMQSMVHLRLIFSGHACTGGFVAPGD